MRVQEDVFITLVVPLEVRMMRVQEDVFGTLIVPLEVRMMRVQEDVFRTLLFTGIVLLVGLTEIGKPVRQDV
jgi:histone acetyltransferase (RNA polymerase elongator complex component)